MAVDLPALLAALEDSWGPDTAQNPRNAGGPASGQCAVSSMIVRDYLGGDIMTAEVGPFRIKHYWNVLPGKVWLDVTRAQFKTGAAMRSPRLAIEDEYDFAETREKYDILRHRVYRFVGPP